MTLTTDTYWSADGVALNTLAFNIETLAGRLGVPSMRGTDEIIPHAEGERFVPKVVGPNVVTLAMWVRGANENGVVPSNKEAEFQENWRTLHKLFWQPRRQITLQKRFWYGGAIRTASAKAQFAGGLEPGMLGRNAAKFTVDLKIHRGFFFDDNLQTNNLVSGHQNVNFLGDYWTHDFHLLINGPQSASDVQIINWTTGHSVTFDAGLSSIASGAYVDIDVLNWTAYKVPSGGGQIDVSPYLEASGGDTAWFGAAPGVNDIQLIKPGTGAVSLQSRAAWL